MPTFAPFTGKLDAAPKFAPFTGKLDEPAPAVDHGPATDGDPFARVSTSAPGAANTTFTASPAPTGIIAGAGRGNVNPPNVSPAAPEAQSSDPMGTGASEIMAQPNSTGSVFDRMQMDAPPVDYQANQQARDRSRSPESVMFQPARDLDDAQASIARGQARDAAIRAQQPDATPATVAAGLQKGLALSAFKTVQGLRMEYADATGDAATSDEAKRALTQANKWEIEATPKFDSDAGTMSYTGLSGLVNAAPMVAAGTLDPALGLGLFAAQAQGAGYGKYRERGATPAMAALGGTLEGGIMAGTAFLPLSFIANKIGRVGVGEFVTGLVARDVPSMVAQGIATDLVDTAIANPKKTWGDFVAEQPAHIAQSVVSAGIFAAGMGAGHATAKAARAGTEYVQSRMGTPSEQFGRAMGQDVDAGNFAPVDASFAQTNPNLRNAVPAAPGIIAQHQGLAAEPAHIDPIEKIARAGSVDEAIAAANEAVTSATPITDGIQSIRPLAPKVEIPRVEVPKPMSTEQPSMDSPEAVEAARNAFIDEKDEHSTGVASQDTPLVKNLKTLIGPFDPNGLLDAIRWGVQNDRTDIARFAVDKIRRNARPRSTEPGLPTSSPKYEAAKADLEKRNQDNATLADQAQRLFDLQSEEKIRTSSGKVAPEPAAEPPATPVSTPRPDGTLSVAGDPKTTAKFLKDNGITSVIPTKDGVQVGRSQAEQAHELLQDFAPKPTIGDGQNQPVKDRGATQEPSAVSARAGERPADVVAAPVASRDVGESSGERAVPEADANPARPVESPADPSRLGRDNVDLSEGGKPFKTRTAADAAKKLQPMMRVVKTDGGFVLTEKTERQIAAQEAAARRLAIPNTSPAGEAIPAHSFIAAEGGLSPMEKREMSIDGNPRIGNRRLFAKAGAGLTIENATQKLIQDGYLQDGATHTDAHALIKKSLTNPQYTPEGTERMAAAERETQFQDHLTAQQEHEGADPFLLDHEDMAPADVDPRYNGGSEGLKAEVRALADAHGVDAETVMEDTARQYPDATEEEYYAAAKTALETAIARSRGDTRPNAGEEGRAPGESQEDALSRPTPADITRQQDRADLFGIAPDEAAQAQAKADGEAKERADKREAQAAEAKGKRALDKKEKDRRAAEILAEREAAKRAEIDAGVKDFGLGQEAPAPVEKKVTTEQAIGQEDVFGRPANGMFAREESKPFYSALTREVDGINAKSQPQEGWRAQLTGLVKSGKVKADEIEWSGLNDWLKLQTGKVTKEQIKAFLDGNGVQVHEVTKGEPRTSDAMRLAMNGERNTEVNFTQDEWLSQSEKFERTAQSWQRNGDERQARRFFDLAEEAGRLAEGVDSDTGSTTGTAKFGQYQLPGGKNYRELLLTLPEKQSEDQAARRERRNAALNTFPSTPESRAVLEETRGPTASPAYKSGHWDEPNVLAHIRMNERTDADGKKVLFIEEIQSDWGQEGKKNGFTQPAEKLTAKLVGKWNAGKDAQGKWEVFSGAESRGYFEGNSAEEAIAGADANRIVKTPNAPFVGKTDAWVALALKRAIKYAIDNGMDRVAFVNGEQSAARYDLSKQIDAVRYGRFKEGDKFSIGYKSKDGGRWIDAGLHDAQSLPDVVGKDVAERIVNSGKNEGELSGLDLKVGGEGMKKFYDAIIPSVAKDVVRKLGGDGLKTTSIVTDKEGWHITPPEQTTSGKWMLKSSDYNSKGLHFDTEAEAKAALKEKQGSSEQIAFDITPAMREKAADGVPLFARKPTADQLARGFGLTKDALPTADIQQAIDRISAKWTDGPSIQVVQSAKDLPIAAPSDARGLYLNGKVFLVADRMRTQGDVARTVAHEVIGHYGLRQILDDAGWDRLTRNIDVAVRAGNPTLTKLRDRVRAAYVDENGEFNLSPKAEADEIAAKAVEDAIDANGNFKPGYGFLKEVWAKLANWLREKGINVPFSNRELQGMLVASMRNLEAGSRTAGRGESLVAASRENALNRAPANPDIRYARDTPADDAEPHPAESHKGLLSNLIDHALNPISKGIDAAGEKSGVYDLVAPMSAGTQQTRALAQKWINNTRKADYEWNQIDKTLTTKFTLEQRRKMWDAADEENDLRRAGETSDDKGLASLPPEERATLETFHEYSKELWNRAKDVGMVSGDGVDFWTPRMMVTVGESGEYSKPSEGKQGTSEGVGRNFSTSASSTKTRKYETSAETEAAMKAKGGEMVRDIRTMPLAMAKLEKAIAGRELINQIKDLGKATGKDLVNNRGGEGFFTLDHPAFKTFGPRFDENGAVVNKEDGSPVMDAKPIYISNDFKGPLKAILSQGMTSNKLYTGYMLLKSKSMSAIMYSPLVHNQVILGRALAYGGIRTPMFYKWGSWSAKNDIDFMKKMIDAGMVPIGAHNNMLDVGDIASDQIKPGSWSDPNESWIGLGAKKAGNMAVNGLGDKIKAGIDKAGDFWHNKMLWERVGDLQANIAKDVYTKLIAKGLDENAASTVAAHIANRYAGAVGKENMSELAHIVANITLFSKSFNAGNVGSVKDAFYGLPAGLKAQLMENSNAESAIKGLDFAKHKARIGLVRDAAFAIAITSLVQDWVKRDKDKGFAENISDGLDGYQKRAAEAWANAKDNPLKMGSYNPYRLSSTWDNEPGKQDRVDMGAQESGRHEYMRLPTGKVIEDLAGWTMHPWDTADKKKSPLMTALERTRNIKDPYGTPVWDPDGTIPQKVYDLAKAIVGTQVPLDQMQTVKDITTGHGTQLDKDKMVGNFTGLSYSQGHPQGPEGAVEAKTEDRVNTSKKYAMEMVKHLLKYDKEDEARDVLEKTDLTPAEINRTIRKITDPKSMPSAAQNKKFNQHATEEEQEERGRVSK